MKIAIVLLAASWLVISAAGLAVDTAFPGYFPAGALGATLFVYMVVRAAHILFKKYPNDK